MENVIHSVARGCKNFYTHSIFLTFFITFNKGEVELFAFLAVLPNQTSLTDLTVLPINNLND